ncbi:DnaJ domain-containing protein, partial [Pelagophyceae sp. CCMP2097]
KKANRPDLYRILGDDVDETSTEQELRKAYKKMAMKWHPDRFSGKPEAERANAETEFKRVGDAMDFLGDAAKKELWDKGYDRDEVRPLQSAVSL